MNKKQLATSVILLNCLIAFGMAYGIHYIVEYHSTFSFWDYGVVYIMCAILLNWQTLAKYKLEDL